MGLRKPRKAVEETGPYEAEEDDDEDYDAPYGSVDGRPEVFPVSSVWGGEEDVLEEDNEEEPLKNKSVKCSLQ